MDKPEYLSERPNVRKTGVYDWPALADDPPTFGGLRRYATLLRYTDEALREFLAHWTALGWEDDQGRPLQDAKLLLRHYKQDQIDDEKWTNRRTA